MSRPITKANTFATQTGNVPASQLDTDFDALYSAVNDSSNGWVSYVADTGVANAYVVTLTSAPVSYNSGMCFFVLITNANTAASTINVNALGTKAIVTRFNAALIGGELEASQVYGLIYDGTSFRIFSPIPRRAYFTNVTGNQIIDCSGATSVSVGLSVNTNFSPLLSLQHLSLGVPVTVAFTNNFSGPVTLGVTATDTTGTTYTQVTWKFTTGAVDMIHVGTSVPAGITIIASGSGIPFGTSLLMVAI